MYEDAGFGYGSRDDNNMTRSPGYSGENSWQQIANNQRQTQDNDRYNKIFSDQRSVYEGLREVQDAAVIKQSQDVINTANCMAAGIKAAMSGNGSLDGTSIAYLNRQMGRNNTNGIVGGSFGKDGVFTYQFANGEVQSFSPEQRARMMYSMPGIFDRNDFDAIEKSLYQSGYTGKEILAMRNNPIFAKYNSMNSTMDSLPDRIAASGPNDVGGRVIGEATIKRRAITRGNVSSFSSDGRGNFSGHDYDWRTGIVTPRSDLMQQSIDVRKPWRMLSSGNRDGKGNVVEKARWENRVTGEVVEINPGESPSRVRSDLDDAKIRESDAKARLYDAQARAGGFRPSADYSGKNIASIISSILKNDADGSMKKMMQDNPASFYDMVMAAAGGASGKNDVGAVKDGNNGGTKTTATTLGERLKAAELKKRGVGGIVSTKNSDASASSLPAAENANTQTDSKSDFDKENERLISEFKKYGGIVNNDGSFKLGNTDMLPAGDTTDLSDRTGISQELVDLQKKLFDDKSLQNESEKAEEDKVRKELARKYAGNKKGLDKEVKEHMRRWRAEQFKKTRVGAQIERLPAFAL